MISSEIYLQSDKRGNCLIEIQVGSLLTLHRGGSGILERRGGVGISGAYAISSVPLLIIANQNSWEYFTERWKEANPT